MSAPEWLADAARLYSGGASLRAAGEAVGVSGERVRMVFFANSIPTRGKQASPQDRFMRRVTVEDGHWRWHGGAEFRLSGRRMKNPKNSAMELFRGISTGEILLPTCGCEWCIAPEHLAASTSEDGIRARLLERIVVSDSGCWEWTRSKATNGYGRITNSLSAHRAAYELFVGPIPDGMQVCHRCDNPPCCNPAHLFLGTAADNAHDRDAKGRGAFGPNAPRLKRVSEQIASLP